MVSFRGKNQASTTPGGRLVRRPKAHARTRGAGVTDFPATCEDPNIPEFRRSADRLGRSARDANEGEHPEGRPWVDSLSGTAMPRE